MNRFYRSLKNGSQAILAYHEDITNETVLSSAEIDIKLDFQESLKENKIAITDILNRIDASYGQLSNLHDNEDFYIDLTTSTYLEIKGQFNNWPTGWRERSKKNEFKISELNLIFIHPNYHDICALKMYAYRDKDLSYVQALVQGSLLKKKKLLQSIKKIPQIEDTMKDKIYNKILSFYKLPQINIKKGA